MELDRDGFSVLPQVISSRQCESMTTEIGSVFAQQPAGAIGAGGPQDGQRGGLVGGRNLISLWDGWRAITGQPDVAQLVRQHVGGEAGLVRILYFDKPPGRGWSLSLHRDKTIAVAEHHQPPDPFAKPTCKAGVPHVEATADLLSEMLTLRLHLDPMGEENGALFVIPGSHARRSQTDRGPTVSIHCSAGDLFVMRPLLLHGSHAVWPGTTLHRRVVHLELAPRESLPGPYQWHRFVPLFPAGCRPFCGR